MLFCGCSVGRRPGDMNASYESIWNKMHDEFIQEVMSDPELYCYVMLSGYGDPYPPTGR